MNGNAAQPAGQTQQPAGGQTGNIWQSINTQMLALGAIILATLLSLIVLQGVKDQREGRYPGKDYSFIDRLPRVSTALTALATGYFLYLAWADHEQNPQNSTLTWLFVANAFALGAAAIKLDILYTANPNDRDIEEIVTDAVE